MKIDDLKISEDDTVAEALVKVMTLHDYLINVTIPAVAELAGIALVAKFKEDLEGL